MLAFWDCLWRGNLMLTHCDLLGKSWFPYYKHMLILATLQYLIKVQAKETSWKSSICNQIGKMKNCLNEPSIDTVNPILAPKVHKLLLRTSQLTSADLRTWIQTFLSSRIHRLLFDVSERSAKNANTLISELQKSVPTNFYWGGRRYV